MSEKIDLKKFFLLCSRTEPQGISVVPKVSDDASDFHQNQLVTESLFLIILIYLSFLISSPQVHVSRPDQEHDGD